MALVHYNLTRKDYDHLQDELAKLRQAIAEEGQKAGEKSNQLAAMADHLLTLQLRFSYSREEQEEKRGLLKIVVLWESTTTHEQVKWTVLAESEEQAREFVKKHTSHVGGTVRFGAGTCTVGSLPALVAEERNRGR